MEGYLTVVEFRLIPESVTIMDDVFQTGITVPVEVGTVVQIVFGLGIQAEIQMVQTKDKIHINTI
jgi:hypothetical protein